MNMCFRAASRLLENRKPMEVSMFYRYYTVFFTGQLGIIRLDIDYSLY